MYWFLLKHLILKRDKVSVKSQLMIEVAQSLYGVRWGILLKVSTKKLAKMN